MTRKAHRSAPLRVGAALLAVLALTLPRGAAAEAGTAYVRPYYPAPFLMYPGACLAYGACAAFWWDDRRAPRRPVAPEPPSPPEDIWGASGSPWGYVRRLPPPTPQSQIQPRYRDASTVRPEFAEPAGAAPR